MSNATASPTAQFEAVFEESRKELGDDAVSQLRIRAFEQFKRLGLPTTRHEDWKYTDLSPVGRTEWVGPQPPESLSAEELKPFIIDNFECIRFVFVDGRYLSAASTPSQELPDGVVVGNLLDQLKTNEVAQSLLGAALPNDTHHMAALNTALFQDGGFLYVPKNVVFEKPVHFIYLNSGNEANTASMPRSLFVVEPNARATVLETFGSLGPAPAFTNAATEVFVRDNGIFEHYRIQDEAGDNYHVHTLQGEQGRSSNYTNITISTGGRLTRNDTNSRLKGEGCIVTLDGLYVTNNEQLIDNHTAIDHIEPHCASRETYKGILDGKSRGVFNGKVFVRQVAQKTDGQQSNKNLILSNDARVETKPQLEIFADDVRCTHGATVGALDQDALFYLRSRGLPKDEARRVLLSAFAGDITDRVPHEAVRTYLDHLLTERLSLPK